MKSSLKTMRRSVSISCIILFAVTLTTCGGGGEGGGGQGGETPSNASPIPSITSPSDGSTYTKGDSITFSGTGEDPEDGTLTGDSLVWTSSMHGQIGTGTSFIRHDLAAGTHTITLTATDSEDARGSDSVSIISAQVQIDSLGSTSALPASLLIISRSGFDPTADLSVRFFGEEDFSVEIPVVEVSTTALTVPVPPFIDLTTGEFGPGVVDVQVLQKSGTDSVTSNTISGFQILDVPTPAWPAGTITLSFLNGTIDLALQQQNDIKGTPLDTPDLNTAIDAQISDLETLASQVRAVTQDASLSFNLGSIAGNSITMGASNLLSVDRVIIGMLAAQADTSPAGMSAFCHPYFARETLAQRSEACGRTDALEYYMAAVQGDSELEPKALSYFGASASCSAESFNKAYQVVGGAAGVAIGILALAGAPAISLALPAAALLYVTIAGAGGEIALGAALGNMDVPGALEHIKRV